ncbi:MAG: hypothetical protein R3C26_17785 [Calditrichia bacterium]
MWRFISGNLQNRCSKKRVRLSVNGIAQDLEHLQLPMDERRNLVLLFKRVLTNALKHANCDEVLLSFGITESGYEIRLADDSRHGNGGFSTGQRIFKYEKELS